MSDTDDNAFLSRADGFVGKLVKGSCSRDPKGSVHRTWGACIVMLVVYLIVAVVESTFGCCFGDALFYAAFIFTHSVHSFLLRSLHSGGFVQGKKSGCFHRSHCSHHPHSGRPRSAVGIGHLCLETISHDLYNWLFIGLYLGSNEPKHIALCAI